MKPGWNQEWRAPLRDALDSLRDDLNGPFEQRGSELFRDPWRARDQYIDVVLDRSPENLDRFFSAHQQHPLDDSERVRALKLLEMERHAMLMFTSCGWFFDELSGLETVQVIMYAGRALQLAQDLFQDGYEERFLGKLRSAPSNVPELQNGAIIYEEYVKPAQIDLVKVAAHYAISSLFERIEPRTDIFCYDVDLTDEQRNVSGRTQLAIGRAQVRSRITLEHADITYGALHFGDHNISAGVRHFRGEQDFAELLSEASKTFQAGDIPSTIRILDRHFDGVSYSLRSLFKDEQRRVLRTILRSTMEEVETSYTQVYEHHASLMDFFGELGTPLPRVLRLTSEFVLNARIRRGFDVDNPIPVNDIQALLATTRRQNISLDENGLGFVISRRLGRIAAELPEDPDLELLEYLNEVVSLIQQLPFAVDSSRLQNRTFQYLQTVYAERVQANDQRWIEEFRGLSERLNIELPLVSEAVETPVAT
jgi:hypothetical protein